MDNGTKSLVKPTRLELELKEVNIGQLLKHTGVDESKFIRVCMSAAATNPGLREADHDSLREACIACATDGLLPDGKEAGLVVFNRNLGNKQKPNWVKQVRYMPMVSGILKMIRNSGKVKSIVVNMVCENDAFDYSVDSTSGEHLEHRPKVFGERGPVVGVYAMANLDDGSVLVEIMNKGDVDKVKSCSKSADYGPWKEFYDQMAKKTVIRRLSKRLPMSAEAEQAIQRDDDMYSFEPDEKHEETLIIREEPRKPNRLKALVVDAASEPPPPSDEDAPPMDEIPI